MYYIILWLLGDAQNEEYIKSFDLLCQTFDFQSMDVSCGGKVQLESSSGISKKTVAKKVMLTMQNYDQFKTCQFRIMQQDGTGRLAYI